MSKNPVDDRALKAGGVIRQCEPGRYSIRIRVPVGSITCAQMVKITDLAATYGRSVAHLTVRQGIEIPYVRLEDLPAVKAGLAEVGMELGACGPRVRVVTACQGNVVCPQGLGDAPLLALALDARFYGREGLPHKFKMGVTGCPNSCIKPQENDVGFIGVAEPVFDPTDDRPCTACGLCAEVCPTHAVTMVGGLPVIDAEKCCADGRCALICPTDAFRIARRGWDVYVGGKWGRVPCIGLPFMKMIPDSDALDVVERVLSVYVAAGRRGERLRNLMDRMGYNEFKNAVATSTATH